jgi:colanic acid/amylovoran biosynthesis glycosyltransferase
MSGNGRPRLTIYVPHFLTMSMTFIYRQLLGASEAFEASVLTTATAHLDHFPFEPIRVRRRGPVDRLVCGIRHRVLKGSIRNLGPLQEGGFTADLRAIRPALVHAHFGPAGLEILPVVRGLGIPLVVTFHGYDASGLLRRPGYVRELRRLFDYAHVITVSSRMGERLRGLGARPERLHPHHIGVPLTLFPFVERRPVAEKLRAGETVRFLQVSNFVEKKGHALTVEAFARADRALGDWTLTFAGEGHLRHEVEEQARRAGIADRVVFTGPIGQREVADLMARSDVFVHHSVTDPRGNEEGIPISLMEAMAVGLVVVSTRHAGIEELVTSGDEGFLVAERDVDAYVGVLRGLASADPGLPRRARARIERDFDIDRQNRALVDLYRVIAAARG